VYHVEQGDRFGGLVRLQPADEMERDVRRFGQEFRPLGSGFLHAVLTEMALAGGDQGPDGIGSEGLGDGDKQRPVSTPGVAAGPVEPGLH
jgi:hypothetical protein